MDRGVGDGVNPVSDRKSMSSGADRGDTTFVAFGEVMSPPFLVSPPFEILFVSVSTLPVEVVSDGNCGWRFGE